jgi:hypothetical protein
MDSRTRFAFLALILTQAAHSVEEYIFRLYDVFAPAHFVSGLLGINPAAGFVVFNAALVLFGLWCCAARAWPGRRSARGWVWLWVLVEFGNGVGHILLSVNEGGYFPGAYTAPVLLALSIYLALCITRSQRQTSTAA